MAVIHIPYLLANFIIRLSFHFASHALPVGLTLSRRPPEESFIPLISLGVFWPHQYEFSQILASFFIVGSGLLCCIIGWVASTA